MTKPFSLIQRIQSFRHAFRGIKVFFKGTHNAWLHIGVAIIVIGAGLSCGLSHLEWLAVILSIGGVLCAEAMNTAIETCVDLASPGHHDLARDAKDISAGAVLVAVIIAVIVGLLVFVPHVFPTV